jgi:hypothetical protein
MLSSLKTRKKGAYHQFQAKPTPGGTAPLESSYCVLIIPKARHPIILSIDLEKMCHFFPDES